ncbi:MAG: Ig-like domain-containing protein [Eubacterium sp.]|nr:Ig-like domain-containing protein [Eubacterium sp.]
MKNKFTKKALSVLLSVLLAVSGLVPVMTVLAEDGVIQAYELEIFYKDSNTMVPTYDDEITKEKHIEYIPEGETVQYTYKLIDCTAPDNSYIKWYSENPVLVDTDQTGKVKAFDSSKGAVVQSWIDNEVKPIPLIGSVMGTVFEKVFFNEYIDLDSMDTEAIVDLMVTALGSDSRLTDYVESYKGQLVDSLREYLDKVNTPIYCQLFASDGTLLAQDNIDVTVIKNDDPLSNFLPNGTHITNKSQINTTQPKGGEVQLNAITTPQRLKFGVVYSVKSSSIFSQGKVVATVNDSGLVSFKNTGTVTILVSPDSEEVIEAILKLVNYVYALDNTGTLDTTEVADALIKYMGVDINRNVLAGILDAAFAIKDIAGDAADPVQLTATAVEIIANIILQMVYNDSITFNVVDAQPVTNFNIDGVTTVREGSEIQLSIIDVQPEAGDLTGMVWTSSKPEVASVDPSTGIIKGLDANGSLGQLSSATTEITATTKSGVSKTVTVTVTGKTGRYISHVDIVGKDTVEIDTSTNYSYTLYPSRVANAENLYTLWGIKTGEDEDGNPVYTWASEDAPVNNGIGEIDHLGHYRTISGGYCTIAMKAYTGYELSNGNFYEISSYIAEKEIRTGIPVENIQISVTGGTSNGDINRNNTVTINGVNYQYVTIKKNVAEAYAGNGAKLAASVYPATATNQNLTWVVDNGYYNTEVSDDTHSISVKQKAGHEVADTFNIYAVSNDGKIKSNVITVCVTKNYVNSNVVNENPVLLTNGSAGTATHTVSFDGSWTSTGYACYKCNWYSSDEGVFTVKTDTNDNRDAILYGNDVGTATLYCVSADGGIVGTSTVKVRPDKAGLKQVIELCEDTVIIRTKDNKKLYQDYMKKLDLAYSVYYDEEMASQDNVDTTRKNLLSAFFKLGGFVGVNDVKIVNSKGQDVGDFITVDVGTTQNYTKTSCTLSYETSPKGAMYSDVTWTSSDSSVSVDRGGVCRPTSNDPSAAIITCTMEDYSGRIITDEIFVAFARTKATGVELNTTTIDGGKVGETQTITATVQPKGTVGVGAASVSKVKWETSDPEIATVDQNGVVTFVCGGDCLITATTYDGGYQASCHVNVVTNYDGLSNLIQQYSDLQLVQTSYYPDTWETYTAALNEAQAMVNKHTGYSQKEVDAMQATLEAAYNGLKKYNELQGVELYLDGEATSDFYQFDLSVLSEGISYKNAKLDLNVRLYPNNGSYQTVEWVSSTSDISVTNEGVASPTANKSCYGRITCTVTDHFGRSFTDYVWVSFAYFPVTGLELSDNNINGKIGDTYQLSCTVLPVGTTAAHIGKASIQDYYWESDNDDIATIDSNGVVTFVSAGSTKVRAISYDGGWSAECITSTEGDRSELSALLEQYRDVNYQDYSYEVGQAFRRAYEDAEAALTDMTLTQSEIDAYANALRNAGAALANNEYIQVQNINIAYQAWKDPTFGSASQVTSGQVPSKDALSVNISSGYADYNYNNYVILNASVAPSNAFYKTLAWSVDSTTNMKSSISGARITLTPTEKSKAGVAKVTATATDDYGRTYSRTINVVLADKTASNITISDTSLTRYATDSNYTVTATATSTSGTPDVGTIEWFSSDESVATVNGGVIDFIDKGTCTITAKTVDGGYSKNVAVTVYTNFQPLADKVEQYQQIVDSTEEMVYTEESLAVLAEAVAESAQVVNEGKATQAEVNSYLETLNAAYNALVRYIAPTEIHITVPDGQESVTIEHDGYVRKTARTLTNAKIQLGLALTPDNAIYREIEWSSSNNLILVDENGEVTNTISGSKAATITVTVTAYTGDVFTDSINVSFVRYGVTKFDYEKDVVFGKVDAAKSVKPTTDELGIEDAQVASSYLTDCVYTSSDESIATVNASGLVTFVSQGSCTITATTLDGGYTDTITAYTTWDTSALEAAIAQAEQIDYMDYKYGVGTAFKAEYDAAVAVYNNPYASQDEIDEACLNLTEAMTLLGEEGNEFIQADPTIKVNTNGSEFDIENGSTYELSSGAAATITMTLNEGAMIKSYDFKATDVSGGTVTKSGNTLTVRRTGTRLTFNVKFTATDDYDREIEQVYSISFVDVIVNVTDFTFTADGNAVSGDSITQTGYALRYTDFPGIQLGYSLVPTNATAPKSVAWSISDDTYMTVSDTGFVDLTARGKGIARTSNTAVVTCTITNEDNTTVSKSVTVTVGR